MNADDRFCVGEVEEGGRGEVEKGQDALRVEVECESCDSEMDVAGAFRFAVTKSATIYGPPLRWQYLLYLRLSTYATLPLCCNFGNTLSLSSK